MNTRSQQRNERKTALLKELMPVYAFAPVSPQKVSRPDRKYSDQGYKALAPVLRPR